MAFSTIFSPGTLFSIFHPELILHPGCHTGIVNPTLSSVQLGPPVFRGVWVSLDIIAQVLMIDFVKI